MTRFATLLVLLAFGASAAAQTPGSCVAASAMRVLDDSDVQAAVYNNGSLFYANTNVAGLYVVPKDLGVPSIYAAGIWVGGLVGGAPRVAGSRYDNFEFWPGPLEDGATLPDPSCQSFDRIYLVSQAQIDDYDTTGTRYDDLEEWPADLGAPVIAAPGNGVDDDGDGDTDEGTDGADNDGDGQTDEYDEAERRTDGGYDIAGGDRPDLGGGTQAAWWVMNDVGNTHAETNSQPLGIEVRVLAFSKASDDPAFDQATFYRYEILNRSSNAIEDAHIAVFVDADLGAEFQDDYVGSDPSRSLVYTYNADDDDVGGFGAAVPAIGLDVLTGTSTMMYFINNNEAPNTNDPGTGTFPPFNEQYYNIMEGLWKDGTPMTEGGLGYQTNGDVTTYAFSGDPVVPEFWSERRTTTSGGANTPDDRRMVGASPRFTLAPGERGQYDVSFVWARGADHLDSITELRAASDAVQAAYEAGELFPPATDRIVTTELGPGPAGLELAPPRPNPSAGGAEVAFALAAPADATLRVVDVLGRTVATLHDGPLAAGPHAAAVGGLPPGTYVVVLEAGGTRVTRAMTVVR